MIKKWFINRLHTIMLDNDYTPEMITTKECDKKDYWTPTDLILREYYNNGGGSAKGFLGISRAECIKCYEYIKENQQELKELDYYHEEGISNSGFRLWSNYNVH